MNDPDNHDPAELRRLIKAEYATGGTPLLFPQAHKVATVPAPAPAPAAPAAAPVLKKAAPAGPTGQQILNQVRKFLPVAMGEWLGQATVDAPLMKSAPFLDLAIRAKKLGLVPMARYELDDLALLKFAKAYLDMQPDARSRPAMLKAALEATRCTIALRDATLIPPLGKAGRMFKAHEADAMRDRNFASFDEAFEWLDRAEQSGALAKREPTTACSNVSFVLCAA